MSSYLYLISSEQLAETVGIATTKAGVLDFIKLIDDDDEYYYQKFVSFKNAYIPVDGLTLVWRYQEKFYFEGETLPDGRVVQ